MFAWTVTAEKKQQSPDVCLQLSTLSWKSEKSLGTNFPLSLSTVAVIVIICCWICANSFDPDQARQNVGPDPDPICLTFRLDLSKLN